MVDDIASTNLQAPYSMDRRTAISRLGIMLGGTLSASTLSALISGCAAPSEVDFSPRFLSPNQLEALARIVNQIIPDTDTPGAEAAGVHRFIDTLLAEYLSESEAREFASRFDEWTKTQSVDELSDDELSAVLTKIDQRWAEGEDEPLWSSLKQWTVSGYYTSEIGMTKELRLKPFTEARMDMPRSDVERTWSN